MRFLFASKCSLLCGSQFISSAGVLEKAMFLPGTFTDLNVVGKCFLLATH